MTLLANIIPYGISDSKLISGFATTIMTPCAQCYAVLQVFTVALAFVGLLLAAYKVQMGGDLTGLGMQLVMTLLVAVTLNYVPYWILNSEITLGPTLMASLGINVEQVLLNFTGQLALDTLDTLPGLILYFALGFWGIGIGFIVLAAISLLLLCIAWVLCGMIWGGVLLGYLCQIAAVYIGLALAPIFLGMFLWEKTKEIGFKYFMGLTGVLCWQLGWGLGFALFDASASAIHDLLFGGGSSGGDTAALQIINAALAGLISSGFAVLQACMVYAILTKAPKLITQAITAGAQMGTGLISAAAGTAASSVGGTMGAAASIGMVAASGGAAAPAAAGGGAAMGASKLGSMGGQ